MVLSLRRISLSVLLLCALAGCDNGSSTSAPAQAAPSTATQQAAPPQLNAEPQGAAMQIDAARAMQYVKEIVALGPRFQGSKGQEKMANYLRGKLKNDGLEEDAFTADTPAGKLPVRNLVAKFQGTRDGIIVLGSHIDTNYTLRNTNYVGANDGGSSTAVLLAIADQLRGKKLEGFSIWLAFLDGEEAVQHWSDTDSIYGSRHLAAKWQQDGNAKKIKAFLLLDMIGDADLHIEHDQNSTSWLQELVFRAAERLGYQSHFDGREFGVEDDHLPFMRMGVPVMDIIDMDYGYKDSYHHTTADTIDKLSVRSLQIIGDVVLETIRLLNANADHLPPQSLPPSPKVPS